MTEPNEVELASRLEAKRRERVEAAVAEIIPILDRHGVILEAQVTIQGNTLATQVLFRAKD